MSLTYGQVKARVMNLLDEAGVTPSASTLTKIQDFTNDVQVDLASTVSKIPAVNYITLNPVLNDSSYDTSKLKQHLPDVDFSITLVNAKSCFFECMGPATVIIEQSADNGVTYSNIETITILATVTNLTEYRRLITPAASTNIIRLRFTGSYVYNFRNYILYPYTWSAEADVQQHRPYFEYTLPIDFLSLSHIMAKRGYGNYALFSDYAIRPDKIIAINRYYAPAEFAMHYHKKPAIIVFAGDATDDTKTFEIADDAAEIMPLGIAGRILVTEDEEGKGIILLNEYESKKANLSKATAHFNKAISLFGW